MTLLPRASVAGLALLLASLAIPLGACSSAGSGSASKGASGSGGSEAASTTGSATTTTTATTGSTGSAGGGGSGGGCVDTGPASTTFVPTPADIQFTVKNPLPAGESLVFNDWTPAPNVMSALSTDGKTVTPLFAAYRLWTFGVSHDAETIAFSCGDPEQEKHYGLTIGDSIQHTWAYDSNTGTASLLADGNVNDECHVFGPGDAQLFLCRRYDFTACGLNQGYRVGKIDLSSKAFTFLTPADDNVYSLHGAPLADGSAMLFEDITLAGANAGRSIWKQGLPSGTATMVKASAGSPVISPDGARYAFTDYTDAASLHVVALDGTGDVRLSDGGDSATWSPDGTKIAYLVQDDTESCSHIDVVPADGSAQPTRLRDCTTTTEFITELHWVKN